MVPLRGRVARAGAPSAPKEKEMRPPSSDVTVTGTMPLPGQDTSPESVAPGRDLPEWLRDARDDVPQPGQYLAYESDGRRIVVPLAGEWTRIGRSLAADVRFDDATVSRRHALIVNQADGVRVLDDRSLNGVYVNGEQIGRASGRERV